MFSIIIPVYNSEKYITECLASIQGQTVSEWECIIVDDGSADLTLDIVRAIARDDKRITVLCQNHEGVSAARNRGLAAAKGELILFCDSDDYWDRELLESCAKHMEGTDCLVFGMVDDVYETDGSLISSKPIGCTSGAVEDLDLSEDFVRIFQSGLMASACNKVYRRRLLEEEGTCFDTLCTVQEDYKLNFDYLLKRNQIRFLHLDLYHYRHIIGEKEIDKRRYFGTFLNAHHFYESVERFSQDKLHRQAEDVVLLRSNIIELYLKEICSYIRHNNKSKAIKMISILKNDVIFKKLITKSKGRFSSLFRAVLQLNLSTPALLLLKLHYLNK